MSRAETQAETQHAKRKREREGEIRLAAHSAAQRGRSGDEPSEKQNKAKKSKKREGQNNIERAFDTNNDSRSDCDSDANAICSCRCRRLACHGIGEPASRQGFPLRRQLAVVPQHSKAADVSSGKQQAVRGKAEQQRRTEIKTQLKHKETQQSKLNSTEAKATLQRKLNKGNSSKETQLRQLNKQNKLNSVRGKEKAKERKRERVRR